MALAKSLQIILEIAIKKYHNVYSWRELGVWFFVQTIVAE